jgi:hypothetical protein
LWSRHTLARGRIAVCALPGALHRAYGKRLNMDVAKESSCAVCKLCRAGGLRGSACIRSATLGRRCRRPLSTTGGCAGSTRQESTWLLSPAVGDDDAACVFADAQDRADCRPGGATRPCAKAFARLGRRDPRVHVGSADKRSSGGAALNGHTGRWRRADEREVEMRILDWRRGADGRDGADAARLCEVRRGQHSLVARLASWLARLQPRLEAVGPERRERGARRRHSPEHGLGTKTSPAAQALPPFSDRGGGWHHSDSATTVGMSPHDRTYSTHSLC